MSRHLPAHPNLEHLKNQAKDLLDDLQRQNPDSKLADALHAIACEYGFTTWPILKAHVESLPRPEQHPFAGSWTANVEKSKRHPANQFQRATLQFAMVGDTVTITNVVVNASGQEEHGENTMQADGKEHSSGHGDGYALTARWRGSHVLETVATKDGDVVGRGTYEVSADGRTLTVSAMSGSTNAHGWRTDFEQVIVLERDVENAPAAPTDS